MYTVLLLVMGLSFGTAMCCTGAKIYLLKCVQENEKQYTPKYSEHDPSLPKYSYVDPLSTMV